MEPGVVTSFVATGVPLTSAAPQLLLIALLTDKPSISQFPEKPIPESYLYDQQMLIAKL